MGMGIRYDYTHTNHTVLLLIFDTVHTAPYGGAYGGPGPVTQCHSGTGRHAWPHPSRIPNAIPNSICFASSYLLAPNMSSKLLSECLSGVSMERLDSSALGSFPRYTALDAEVEHSMDNDVENSMDNDDSQALANRKVSRTQNLEGKEYAASKLAEVLRLRKFKSGHAKYWDQLAVDIVSMEKNLIINY
jgi:hypothetical protein